MGNQFKCISKCWPLLYTNHECREGARCRRLSFLNSTNIAPAPKKHKWKEFRTYVAFLCRSSSYYTRCQRKAPGAKFHLQPFPGWKTFFSGLDIIEKCFYIHFSSSTAVMQSFKFLRILTFLNVSKRQQCWYKALKNNHQNISGII